MGEKLLSIGRAAKKLGVSVDTLRRWDASGKLVAVHQPSGHRYYYLSDLEAFTSDLFVLAKNWVADKKGMEPANQFYCQNSYALQDRLSVLEKRLAEDPKLKKNYPLIVAVAGEIGNNSFDHNLGNWPDIPGIFFGFDLNKKEIVLADRGRGVLKTLKRVKPELASDAGALETAFTEIITGRAPEGRGNGLKFVRQVIIDAPLNLFFQSGSAELKLNHGVGDLNIAEANFYCQGCLALITF